MSIRRADRIGIRRKTILGFCHADWKVTILLLKRFYLFPSLGISDNICRTIESAGDRFNFIPQRHFIGIGRSELRLLILEQVNQMVGNFLGASATLGPVGTDNSDGSIFFCCFTHRCEFSFGVCAKLVNRYNHWNSERFHIPQVTFKVHATLSNRIDIFFCKRIL